MFWIHVDSVRHVPLCNPWLMTGTAGWRAFAIHRKLPASCFVRATWFHYGKHTFKEPGEGVVVHSTYCFSQPTRFAFLHLTSVWNPSSRGLGNPLLSSWALHTHGAETQAAKQPFAQNKTLKKIFNNALPRFFNM